MKIKIEADLALPEKQILPAVAEILLKQDVRELMDAFEPGQSIKLEYEKGSIVITKL
jgi:hypothetical protein